MNEVVNLSTDKCPCQSGDLYQECCAPFHLKKDAPTAEALMRSRYCAFVLELYPYLLDTHHADYRDNLSVNDLASSKPDQWLGLDIEEFIEQGESASVTFKAWFKHLGNVNAIYEKSAFTKENNQWLYTTGEQFNIRLPKANEPCVCKSGKKFKRCCK